MTARQSRKALAKCYREARDCRIEDMRKSCVPIRQIAAILGEKPGTVFSICERLGLVGTEYDARLAVNRR